MTGFAERIVKQSALVCDLREGAGPDARYFILEIDKAQYQRFRQTVEQREGLADLSAFGSILHQGWGEPSEELKQELRRKYGMYEE